ncbi:hypothetical protein [Vibrio vulnificus]|uniref:hypothetical protein n=1 Tax=Vibrio vulnificus TaxID=672 RepID=UPI001029EE92|nr:hypothetical protein [Vibrio vulnificus]RZR29860.1 hypothetical protein D8T33_18980 [Vibrio vulnificus]
MSKVLLSNPHDLNLVKGWAKTLQNILKRHGIRPPSKITILNIVARPLGYTDWAHLAQYNRSLVWFTDINAELNHVIDEVFSLLASSNGINVQKNSQLYNDLIFNLCAFGLIPSTHENEPSTNRIVELLLVPNTANNSYEVIPFCDEVDLVLRLGNYVPNSILFGKTVNFEKPLPIAINEVSCPPSIPLHRTIHDLLPKGYAFIAYHKCQYVGVTYVLGDELKIPESLIQNKLMEASFINPNKVVYEFKKTRHSDIVITNVTEFIDSQLKINVKRNFKVYEALIEMFEREGHNTLYVDFGNYMLPVGKRPKELLGAKYLERCDNVMAERFGS